jgi:hypothetical protein
MSQHSIKAAAHSGDIGDIFYCLPVFKSIGVTKIYYVNRPVTKPISKAKYLFMKPLVEAQGFDFLMEEPREEHYASWDFRKYGLPLGQTLQKTQSLYHDSKYNTNSKTYDFGFLNNIPDSKGYSNTIIFHRSFRYRNPNFPLSEILREFSDRILFIGFDDEYRDIQKTFNVKIPRVIAKDALQMASLIKSSFWFLGNQSSPMALAFGVGANILQEVCLWAPDCIYSHKKCFYSFDGVARIAGKTFGTPKIEFSLAKNITPHGGWQAISKSGETLTHDIYKSLHSMLLSEGVSSEEADHKIHLNTIKKNKHLIKKCMNADFIARLIQSQKSIKEINKFYSTDQNQLGDTRNNLTGKLI